MLFVIQIVAGKAPPRAVVLDVPGRGGNAASGESGREERDQDFLNTA
ncbi:hypothetical protein WEH80_29060 [Actinomycetes bacterium KLBMP 9759]